MLRKWRIYSLLSSLPGEAWAGLVLMAAAALAVVAANSGFAAMYHDVLHHPLGWTPVARLGTWHAWINDGLMAVFFFTVGLEIKREVVDGELSSAERRRMPVLAAVCGMIVPAALYLLVTRGEPALAGGWAIPAATDIAFAMGVLALLGPRVPAALRLFLLTVAIVDDMGAVAVIAVFYNHGLDPAWLGASAAVLALMVLLGRLGVKRVAPYVLLGVVLWFAVLQSGIHATVAGVLAAMTVPLALDRRGHSPLLRLEHALVGPNAYVIVPLFGFANAGVALGGGNELLAPLPLAIAAGLVLGKQAGIFGSVMLAARAGFGELPRGTSAVQLWGMSLLCGIGFTMSLFIAALAFPQAPQLAEEAKLGILGGSVISAIAGFHVLRLARPRADLLKPDT